MAETKQDYSTMSAFDLRIIAKSQGLKGWSKATKPDLIAALQGREDTEKPTQSKPKKKRTVGPYGINMNVLKKNTRALVNECEDPKFLIQLFDYASSKKSGGRKQQNSPNEETDGPRLLSVDDIDFGDLRDE